MARTFGGASTDKVVGGLTTYSTLRSYSIWFNATGDGASSAGRLWDKIAGAELRQDDLDCKAGSLFEYQRGWTGANGTWTIPRPADSSGWHHVLLTYDTGSTANDPAVYIDGAAKIVTRTVAPTLSPRTDGVGGFTIGNRQSDSLRNFAGGLGEFAVWNALLGAGDAADLYRGVDASLIQPGSLVEYLRLGGGSPEPGLAGDATVTGTVVSKGPDWLFPGPQPSVVRPFLYVG